MKKEIPITETLLEKAVSGIGQDTVLIGGQALALWAAHYGIREEDYSGVGSISDDADFLGSKADVAAIASMTHGQPIYPGQHGLTALVGQILIPVNAGEFVNVDVLHRVIGLDKEAIQKNAMSFEYGNARFKLMNPLDLLASRIENLRLLEEKRNDQGVMQARIAIRVTRAFIQDHLKNQDEKTALRLIERVATVAKSPGGRQVAQNYQLSFATAIPFDQVKNQNFREIRWPKMREALIEAAKPGTPPPVAKPRPRIKP